jgi:hypothetical protein
MAIYRQLGTFITSGCLTAPNICRMIRFESISPFYSRDASSVSMRAAAPRVMLGVIQVAYPFGNRQVVLFGRPCTD